MKAASLKLGQVDDLSLREDGWPTCPACGNVAWSPDVASIAPTPDAIAPPARPLRIRDRLACTACSWKGLVTRVDG